MKSAVIVFPGSNCDRDISVALKKFQIKNEMVWHDESDLPKSDLVVLPGGFSYGDYLRTGCIASKSKIINKVYRSLQNFFQWKTLIHFHKIPRSHFLHQSFHNFLSYLDFLPLGL